MRKIIFLILITAFVSETAWAKGTADSTVVKKQKRRFVALGMGAMIGCSDCQSTGKVASLTASAVYGLRLGKRWSVGMGAGFDNYEHWKAMPFYTSASFDLFGRKKNKVYAQLNYGYSIARVDKSDRAYGYQNSHGGEILSPSLGYKIDYGPVWLAFSVGLKFQRVFTNYNFDSRLYTDYIPVYPYSSPNTTETRMDMTRLVMGMTVGWK